MRKILGIGFILILTMGLLAACGSDSVENNQDTNKNNQESNQNNTANNTKDDSNSDKEILKMATSADFPPFESRNPEGEFQGLDIELAEMIADELGYELEIEDMKFGGLVGALQADRVDMVLSGMSADEKRKQNVDFSIEYNESTEMFITKPDNKVEAMDNLKGKTVGVQLGSIQDEGAEKLKDEYDFEIKKVDDAAILIQELMSNRIDVVYMDKEVAIGYVDEQNLFGFDDPSGSSPGMAIAFPKGSELVDSVNNVLKDLEESGKLQELKDKWLSE